MATLYLVATPIGNLEDITLRALRILREASVIACEDTRTTKRLLSHFGIPAKLISYTEHNSDERIPQIIALLQEGDVALVSEAGMPGVSDPGARLVEAAHEASIPVSPVPGPSALPAAIAAAGDFPAQSVFLGFLPTKPVERRRLLEAVAPLPFSIVLYEAPHRIRKRLEELIARLGDRRVTVCREMTKLYEEIYRGTLTEALEHFQTPRGEFVLVIDSARGREVAASVEEPVSPEQVVADLRSAGYAAREAVAILAKRFNLPRRAAYTLWLADNAHEDE